MQLNIQKTFYTVSDFIGWQRSDQLILSPNFQRRSIWKTGAKSYLIDSIVRGMPIPIIFLRAKRTDPNSFEPVREVVDGQQRLRTILSFVSPECLDDFDPKRDAFTVSKTHNASLAGKKFFEIDDQAKVRILEYKFDCHILPSNIDDRQVIQIFRRMNSTNYTVNKQELRNSDYFGEFKSSVYELAAEQLQRWRNWKTFTEDNISRMAEVELTSECIEMIINGFISGKSAPRLNKLYAKFDEEYVSRGEVEKRFRMVMDFIHKNFGDLPNEFVFFKRTLFYTFFSFIYDLMFGFADPHQIVLPIHPTIDHIGRIREVNEKLHRRTAPNKVLEATDRRTTNPKERKELFDYLDSKIRNA